MGAVLGAASQGGAYNEEAEASFRQLPRERIRELLARLMAFDNARAMLDITRILPPERVVTNPMEPVLLGTVLLIKRDPEDRTVLETLSLGQFMGRLLLGETPERTREVAYNAYRAVDEEAERLVIRTLEAQAARAGGTPEALYEAFLRHPGIPETLAEEFELFRLLHRACRCYSLNTVLAAHGAVRGLAEAVAHTVELIAHAVASSGPVRLTVDDYRRALTSAGGRP